MGAARSFVFNSGTAGNLLLRNDGATATSSPTPVRFLLAETPLESWTTYRRA